LVNKYLNKQIRISSPRYAELVDSKYEFRCKSFDAVLREMFQAIGKYKSDIRNYRILHAEYESIILQLLTILSDNNYTIKQDDFDKERMKKIESWLKELGIKKVTITEDEVN
jgi:hypothetical protein